MITSTDPISDMLTRIRNAILVGKDSVTLPHSKVKEGIAGILKDNGFIAGVKVDESGQFKAMTIDFQEGQGAPVINTLSRISKPGRRIYSSSQDIPMVLSGRGIVIVSTSSGLMTGKEARRRGLGGELICKIW